MVRKKFLRISQKSNVFLLLLVLGIFSFIIVIFSLRVSSSEVQEVRTRAEGPTCDPQCVTEPSCCVQVLKRLEELGGPEGIMDLPDNEQPYHECPTLYHGNNELGYCRLETCNQLPAGVRYRGHCGWYWYFHDGSTNTPNGYACMIGDSEATMRPICGGGGNPPPTNPPVPTSPPMSTVKPTKKPKPTKTPTPKPTRVPSAVPTLPFGATAAPTLANAGPTETDSQSTINPPFPTDDNSQSAGGSGTQTQPPAGPIEGVRALIANFLGSFFGGGEDNNQNPDVNNSSPKPVVSAGPIINILDKIRDFTTTFAP